MARLTIRIDLDEETAFGPGKAKLLETLDDVGSIRRAAAAMDMSYRRAWLLIQDIEAALGAAVVVAKAGGNGGGGVKLTALGQSMLARYRRIERRAAQAAAPELTAISKLCRKPRRTARTSNRRSIRKRSKPGAIT